MVTNATGTAVQTLEYYPYGAIYANTKSTSLDETKKYIGEQYDSASGLSYLNARYYNGAQGQFLSEDPTFLGDPKQQNLADPQSLNSYNYANNNPIVKKDPSGKCIEDACVGEILAVYTIATIAVDAYDVYNTNIKYSDVFTSQEKNRSIIKLGFDVALGGTSRAAKALGREGLSLGLDVLTASADALDTYFGKQVYKTYNEKLNLNSKMKESGSNVPMPSLRNSNFNDLRGNTTSNTSRSGNVQSSSPNQSSGGSSYNQLVSSLNQLIASLSAYVSSLSTSKTK